MPIFTVKTIVVTAPIGTKFVHQMQQCCICLDEKSKDVWKVESPLLLEREDCGIDATIVFRSDESLAFSPAQLVRVSECIVDGTIHQLWFQTGQFDALSGVMLVCERAKIEA